MISKKFLAITAISAAAFSGAASANAEFGAPFAIKFEGTRTRAEVMAEAAKVSATRSTEPAGSRVAAPLQSGLDARVVRAQAAQALRLGKIPSGEIGL
ncbi:MAG: hypothetical protein JWP65_3314 [Ramlibacter sp.]|jgi:hypothetical protein|uniref:DUF4148 domain-containing protein n=1 Tax=Ramlibacter sp. TaxID=1917967 RepID=UPI002A3D8B7F|nr:hypothetical protein [Ramlibacter sp.]